LVLACVCFAFLIIFVSVSLRFFPFRLFAKQAKKAHFFSKQAKKVHFIFASFCFEAKNSAHPFQN